MAFDKFGTLVVNITVADGALPLRDAKIKITGADEENSEIVYSIRSDIDGISEVISLPTPEKALSLAPGATAPSYAVYDIAVSSEGYYTKRIYNVPVFEGTETILPVNMLPLAIHESNTTFPRGNLGTVVEENPYL